MYGYVGSKLLICEVEGFFFFLSFLLLLLFFDNGGGGIWGWEWNGVV